MYSLFQLLFKASYWKMLGRGATWSEAGRSFRRIHKDRRARKHIFAFGLMLLIPILCLLYAAWLVGSGALLLVPFIVPVLIWRERRAKRDALPLSIIPSSKFEIKELSEDARREVRLYFEQLAVSYAVILDRAGSESFLKTKVLPDGFVATTRRVHLDLLNQYGAWERIAAEDRMAMLAPDGHWEWEQVYEAQRSLEPLRLLRWALRVDYFLPTLGQQITWEYSIAHELTQEPERIRKSTEMVNRSDLEIGRDAAQHLLYRCVAEQIHRGLWAPQEEEGRDWARGVIERLAGNQHEDFVLGSKLVGEVDDTLLTSITRLARQRMDFLNWIIRVLDGEPLPTTFSGVFRPKADVVEAQNIAAAEG